MEYSSSDTNMMELGGRVATHMNADILHLLISGEDGVFARNGVLFDMIFDYRIMNIKFGIICFRFILLELAYSK